MMPSTPEYQLYSESTQGDQPGRWRFVLRAGDGSEPVVAEDVEPEVRGERLELLSVVRGLEALDQPSRVTLMTPSVYVREGIRYGLEEWRSNDWQWESFGRMIPVKNSDLWQRVDRAMQYHDVDCCVWRFDPPHESLSDGAVAMESESPVRPACCDTRPILFQHFRRAARRLRRGLATVLCGLRDGVPRAWLVPAKH